MKALVLFHRADFDGVCSAAIVKKFVPDCELHGIDYGDEFPWDKVAARLGPSEPTPGGKVEPDPEHPGIALVSDPGLRWPIEKRKVYLVDFSLKPDEMKRLAECCDLVWIDHHKSALDACADLSIEGLRHNGLAGCELTWEWFVGIAKLETCAPPEAVRLLGRYDVWDAQNPEWSRIETFQFGMRCFPGAMDPENPVWKKLFEPFLKHEALADSIFVSGLNILSYRDQEAAAQCREGAQEFSLWTKDFVPVRPDGGAMHEHRCIALNTAARGSWQFNSVYDPEKHDVMVAYCKLKTGKWRVSLYSTKPEVDCGAIAKSFGGGGHAGAAGFLCDELPWEAK